MTALAALWMSVFDKAQGTPVAWQPLLESSVPFPACPLRPELSCSFRVLSSVPGLHLLAFLSV